MNVHHKSRYDRFIEYRRIERELDIFEIHHVIPKSMGGSDDIDNLIKLTPREHYLAHLMLHKAYPESVSMLKGLQAMFRTNFFVHGPRFTGRKYERMRRYAFRRTAKPPKDILFECYYTQRKSLAKISKEFGVSEPTVKKWYVHTFKDFKPRDNRKIPVPTKEELENALSCDSYPFLKVQKQYGCKLGILQRWRTKYNLTAHPGTYER